MTEPAAEPTPARHRRGGRPTSGDRIRVEERRARVAKLLVECKPQSEIAQIEGVSRSAIRDDVTMICRAWQRITAASYDAHVAVQNAALDELQAVWMPLALAGDEKGFNAVMRILQRRARLLGLDAPSRSVLTGADGGPIRIESVEAARAEVLLALDELEARRAQREAIVAESRVRVEGNGQG